MDSAIPVKRKIIYCDTNIYSRPFDDITQQRIYNEAIACSQIFEQALSARTLSIQQILSNRMDVKEKKLERTEVIERGWEALVKTLGPEHAQEFVMTFPREDEDSVSYWKKFWGDKGVDEIYQAVRQSC